MALIGGSGSGAGKTLFACKMLNRLKGWGAVKFTPDEIYTSIIDDPDILSEEGKDTQRFLRAGASDVVWVKSTREDAEETLSMAMDALSHLKGIIVEGNSAIEVLKPDIVIFISKGQVFKESAFNILRCADLIIYEGEPPKGAPVQADKFRSDDEGEYINSVLRMVDERKAHGRNQEKIC